MQDFFIRNNLLVFWVEPAGVVSVWQAGNSFKPVQLRGTA